MKVFFIYETKASGGTSPCYRSIVWAGLIPDAGFVGQYGVGIQQFWINIFSETSGLEEYHNKYGG